MPNRILREGILTSERIDKLAPAEEVFYRRIMSIVDDFGRYFASPMLVLAACYPLKIGKVTEKMILQWMQALIDNDLLQVYEVAGKRYLEIMDFRQQQRAAKSKYPARDGDALEMVLQQPEPAKSKRSALNGAFSEFWKEYPVRVNRADAEKSWISLNPDRALSDVIIQAVRNQKAGPDWKRENGKYIPHAFRWLNKRRWEDEVKPAVAEIGPDEALV